MATPSGHKDEERLTEELLEELLSSATPEAYLDRQDLPDRSLADYLQMLMREHGLKRAEVIRAAGINATFAYQVFKGERNVGRDHALMLAFALGCDLREAQRLLRLAGQSELWCKVRRDAIIIHCLSRGLTRQACDDELYRLGEATLAPV